VLPASGRPQDDGEDQANRNDRVRAADPAAVGGPGRWVAAGGGWMGLARSGRGKRGRWRGEVTGPRAGTAVAGGDRPFDWAGRVVMYTACGRTSSKPPRYRPPVKQRGRSIDQRDAAH